jgi:hypothetical protein
MYKISIMDELGLYLSYWVRDKDGRCKAFKHRRSHSFVGNFFKLLYLIIGKNASQTIGSSGNVLSMPYTENRFVDTTGASRNFLGLVADKIVAGSGVTNRGIIVGTGGNPVTLNDYNLQSIIPHGTAAGQLTYSAMTDPDVQPIQTASATSWYYDIHRIFRNDSSSVINIREVGLVAALYDGNTITPCLIARDVLITAIALAPADQALIRYRLRVTV